MRGKEQGQQINGVDTVQAGSGFRREILTFLSIYFFCFRGFSSSVGGLFMSDQR